MSGFEQLDFEEMKSLFHPRSIALIGVPREYREGRILFEALLDQSFPGPLFLVNPQAKEIEGVKVYAAVKDIFDPVDMAIVMVPRSRSLQIIQECVEKKVKLAVLFTSGYGESGTEDGRELERCILEVARSGGMRLIGPNCMGIYSPEAHLSNFPRLSKMSGKMGLISQSGSLTNMLCRLMPSEEMFFSMAFSTGNEADLNSADFLWYLGQDENTKFIGLYLEGLKDGRRFFNILKETTLRKCVFIWKAGTTEMGNRAAFSHTGSMTGSSKIWEAVFRQTGAICVVGIEEFIDMAKALYFLPEKIGRRIAVISGPGGLAVAAADACEKNGLQLADLNQKTSDSLKSHIPSTGTSFLNPVDLGFFAAMKVELFRKAAEIVGGDPGVEALFIIGGGLTSESSSIFLEMMAEAHETIKKPILIISLPGMNKNYDYLKGFFKHGIPIFDSVERAIASYEKVSRAQECSLVRKNLALF